MRQNFVFVVIATACLFATSDLLARGGRGGGGRGGGGGGRGGGGGGGYRAPSGGGRSPSMSHQASRPSAPAASRPAQRPTTSPPRSPGQAGGARPGNANRPGTAPRPGVGGQPGAATRPAAGGRPSQGQLNDFLNISSPGAGARPGTLPATRPGGSAGAVAGGIAGGIAGGVAGGAAADFLQGGGARPGTLPAGNRPGAGVADRPGVGTRPGAGQLPAGGNRPNRIENSQQRQDNRVQRRDEVRDQVRDNHPRLDFWSDHPNWARWRINQPYRWATWGALAGWCSYDGGSEPISYGYGENVYYEGDSVYYGDQAVATTEEYAQQAEAIIDSAPPVTPETADWMPLGVFALTPDGQATGPDPSLFLQLAISKEGVINGTLHNTATNSTQTIEGLADKQTQRCAWCVKDQKRPIMETGLGSLTQDSSTALVHFADGQTQQWMMVRLKDPKGEQP